MPWPASTPYPTVSIVMPVQRHRGHLPAAITGWSTQDYPREKLEFVFASNGREPQIDALVEERLRHVDTARGGIAYIKTDNELAQYSYAARYARGEWLLFTEPHCIPQRDCIRELIGTLIAQDMAGGCVRTLADHSRYRGARIEERIYQEDFADWSCDGDWRKFTKRGFALRREVYRSIGGFEAEYGWFSELVIAARLDAEGHRVGFVPTAAVQHFNATNMQEMFDYLWEYRREQARYLDEGSPRLKPYFANMFAPPESPPAFVVAAMRRAMHAALREGLCTWRTPAGRRLAAAMLRAISEAYCGQRTKLAVRYWLARMRYEMLSITEEQAYRNFVSAFERLGQWADATYVARATALNVSCFDDAGEMEILPGESRTGLFGFHTSERYRGRMFRWTSPVASIVVDLPPDDYELSLDMGDVLPNGARPKMFWNGQRLQAADAGCGVALPADAFAAGSPQVLTLIAAPVANRDARETRELGVPLFAVAIRKTKRAALRIAA